MNEFLEKWKRVSAEFPCPICTKPDWCLVHQNGKYAICPRTPSPVRMGDAGYLHSVEEEIKVPKKNTIKRPAPINWRFLASYYWNLMTPELKKKLSESLGLGEHIVDVFMVGWDGEAYTIPMRNGIGEIIGIQRRFPSGKKLVIKGSQCGIFIPRRWWRESYLLVCEGMSDAAALVEMYFPAIGRYNCSSGSVYIYEFLCRHPEIQRVIIISDADGPGYEGALRLCKYLSGVRKCAIMLPEGGKDVREWKKFGLTREMLLAKLRKVRYTF